jgi:hypothetical protein
MSLLKKNKVVFISSAMMVLTVGTGYVYQYISMSPKDVVEITPEYVGDATEFNFLVTDNLSYWTGKVVQITGKVTELTEYGVVMNGTIFCQFENGDDLQSIVENQQINIKGKLVGFDEILMEIKLNQCILP